MNDLEIATRHIRAARSRQASIAAMIEQYRNGASWEAEVVARTHGPVLKIRRTIDGKIDGLHEIDPEWLYRAVEDLWPIVAARAAALELEQARRYASALTRTAQELLRELEE